MTDFYDSVSPEKIPAGAYACLYADGDYAAPASAASRFAGVQWITVTGETATAGLADYEPGNPVYGTSGRLLEWSETRIAAKYVPVVYCDRSNLPGAISALGSVADEVWWWVPTLDNRQWTQAELIANIALPQVNSRSLWACQYAGGTTAAYDASILYTSWSLAQGATGTTTVTVTPIAPGGAYTVKAGDTLSAIAETHGITLAALEAANPQIENFNLIYPGQVIHFPSGTAGSTYTVRAGDNMTVIAQRYGITLAQLEEANPQITNPNLIYPGEVVRIP